MFTANNLTKPTFANETRLGLVLYGGVSLAVYMNGICREFYDAICGRGVYLLIKALTDSDIVVDIVSGTSAGGVNGVLLSYAIANSDENEVIDFAEFAKLWREAGDIKELINHQGQRQPPVNSILDGEGFYQQKLQEALRVPKKPVENEWYSDFGELDLFITATDLLGQINSVVDKTGTPIQIKDHKIVFNLKYRQDQLEHLNNPFLRDTTTQEALAKLCRITSCFPVAFPVVEVMLEPLEEDSHNAVDSKLIEWGELDNRKSDKPSSLYFVDGGVLNNRPFSYTIKTIYSRLAYRPVSRQLFYLDPNPDEFFGIQDNSEIASWWRAGLSSKIDIPNYQSIAQDLKLIQENNQKVIQYRLIKNSLKDSLHLDSTYLEEKEKSPEYLTYLKCRFLRLFEGTIQQIFIKISVTDKDEPRANIDELKNQKDVLNEVAKEFDEEITKQTQQSFINICNRIKPLDIDFLIRKYCFLLGMIAEECDQKIGEDKVVKEYLALKYFAYQLSWQFELLKAINKAINKILKYYHLSEFSKQKKIYDYLIGIYTSLLSGKMSGTDSSTNERILDIYYEFFKIIHFPKEIELIETQQSKINWSNLSLILPSHESDFAKKIFAQIYQLPICKILTITKHKEQRDLIETIKEKIDFNNNNTESSILNIIDKKSKEFLDDYQVCIPDSKFFKVLKSYFEWFELIDIELYPYESLNGVAIKTVVDLTRISPKDAQKGLGKTKTKKLMGTTFNAFGGFFSKFWRSNDLLWGRLDGLNRLVDSLITFDSLQKGLTKFYLRYGQNQKPEEFIKQLIESSLPEAKDSETAEMTHYLKTLLNLNSKILPKAKDSEKAEMTHYLKTEFNEFLENVVKAGQREIILEDFPNVIADMDKKSFKLLRENLTKHQELLDKLRRPQIKSISPEEKHQMELLWCDYQTKKTELKLDKSPILMMILQVIPRLLGVLIMTLKTNLPKFAYGSDERPQK